MKRVKTENQLKTDTVEGLESWRKLSLVRQESNVQICLNVSVTLYEGRSIKIQNGAISLILKVWKIRNISFVRNLILNTIQKFFDDDLIIVTSSVHRTKSVCVLFYPPVFYNSQAIGA